MIAGILLCSVLVAYLVGSVPSGFLVAQYNGIRDIRSFGSGNIGATNVGRMLGLNSFFLVFFLDFFKTYSLLLFLQFFGVQETVLIAASVALLVGNTCPVFLNFKGGKGIATSFAILLALKPLLLISLFITWLLVFIRTKTVGTASVVTLGLLPFYAMVIFCMSYWLLFLWFFVAGWCLWMHRDNIRRFVMLRRSLF